MIGCTVATSRVSILRDYLRWREWVATPAELEGLELRFVSGSNAVSYELRTSIERAEYAGRFLGRVLFRVRCDDGQVRRVWVDPHGIDTSEPRDYWRGDGRDGIPYFGPRVGPRVVWRISADSPDLMDFARME